MSATKTLKLCKYGFSVIHETFDLVL